MSVELVKANDVPAFGQSTTEKLSREPLINVLENYLQYYAAGEGHTARAKRYDLQHFLEFLGRDKHSVKDVTVADWTLQETKDFVDKRLSSGEAPATVSRRLATVKHFGRTLAERVPGYINPAREVKGPVVDTSRPHGLTEKDIELLQVVALEEVQTKPGSFSAVRNQFLLELLLSTGLRADEVRLLVMSQISEDFTWLINVRTKGRKFRKVYLDSSIQKRVEDYLSRRETELEKRFPGFLELPLNTRQKFPVLVSVYKADIGKPESFALSAKTIWRIISQFGKKAQAKSTERIGSLHPHKLRHTFAHGLLDSSKDVRLVAQALGHSDVRITMRYTERTEEQLADAIEKKIGGN